MTNCLDTLQTGNLAPKRSVMPFLSVRMKEDAEQVTATGGGRLVESSMDDESAASPLFHCVLHYPRRGGRASAQPCPGTASISWGFTGLGQYDGDRVNGSFRTTPASGGEESSTGCTRGFTSTAAPAVRRGRLQVAGIHVEPPPAATRPRLGARGRGVRAVLLVADLSRTRRRCRDPGVRPSAPPLPSRAAGSNAGRGPSPTP